jgi:Transposase, Mutator family
VLTVVRDALSSNGNGGGAGLSLLDEIVRDEARQILAAALRAEVAAYLEAFADQLDEDGRRLVVRNGYHQQRGVLTAAGAVAVTAPRVKDRRVDPETGVRQRFSSAILPAWARKTPQMTEVLPLLADVNIVPPLRRRGNAPPQATRRGRVVGRSVVTQTRGVVHGVNGAGGMVRRSSTGTRQSRCVERDTVSGQHQPCPRDDRVIR